MQGRAALIALIGCGRIQFDAGPDAPGTDTGIDAADGMSSRGVLARYFIDESASGQSPTLVRDALPNGVDLGLTFESSTNPAWTTVATGRALGFETVGLDGGACNPIEGKLLVLDGLQTASIETRVEIADCIANGSRFVHVGFNDGWGFSLACVAPDRVAFAYNQSTTVDSQWTTDVTSLVTLTLVYDSTQPVPEDRIRLYVDGVRQPDAPPIAVQYETLMIDGTQHLCIGNRFSGGRAPLGKIAYGALYTVALTDAEILSNVARLATNDDKL